MADILHTPNALHALWRAREAQRELRPNVYRTRAGDILPVLELADEPRQPDGTRSDFRALAVVK